MRVVVLCLLAACSFEGAPGTARDDAGGSHDSGSSSGSDSDVPAGCFGNDVTTVCPRTPPTGVRTLSGTVDTADDPLCAELEPTSDQVCAIAGETVTIAGETVVEGARPLVIIATNEIHIDAELDVASHVGGKRGPGSELGPCNAGTPPRATFTGGGQGGSFGSRGGDGGDQSTQADSGGTSGTAALEVSLRGGCPGANGNLTDAAGGAGGGVVVLIAQAIDVAATGSINASGAGGKAPGSKNGAGGGGSGGLVVLDAPAITVAGFVFAHGGGGGGGGSNGSGGTDGQDPIAAGTAPGGTVANGGPGGTGSPMDGGPGGAAGNGVNGTDGGGGGGGGAGVILVRRSTATFAPPTVSPPPRP